MKYSEREKTDLDDEECVTYMYKIDSTFNAASFTHSNKTHNHVHTI